MFGVSLGDWLLNVYYPEAVPCKVQTRLMVVARAPQRGGGRRSCSIRQCVMSRKLVGASIVVVDEAAMVRCVVPSMLW